MNLMTPHSPSCRSKTFAFTVTECLVALVMVALLAAILIPVINAATTSSKSAKCTNRLRGLGQAAMLFSVEHDNNQLPYRMEPFGLWYDHLHQYIGRKPGRKGREINGVRVAVEEWYCPEIGRYYHINQVCGWTDGSRTIPTTYLKRGQGCIDNQSIFPLPGGLSHTALFACPSATGSCFTPRNAGGTDDFIGWKHGNRGNVVFMDGHSESIPNPRFESNPDLVNQEAWIFFFGRKR